MSCSCGIPSPDECQAMHYAALIWETENNDYAVHRLRSFTYGLQHPDRYLISAKTFATHLLGVCIGVEYHNDQNLLNNILQTFELGRNIKEQPPLPEYLGNLTIAHIMNAKNAAEYEQRVKEWAEAVWKTYRSYHELAHNWMSDLFITGN